MIRIILLALAALTASPALAASCPSGQHHSGGGSTGRCVADKPAPQTAQVSALPPAATIEEPRITPPSPTKTRSGTLIMKSGNGTDIRNVTMEGAGQVIRLNRGRNANGVSVVNSTFDKVACLYKSYGGVTNGVTIDTVTMTNGRYAGGQCRGIVNISGSVSNVRIRNVDATFVEPITSSGDIYGGIMFGSKSTPGSNFLIEDVILRGLWVSYTDGYANSDGIVVEGGYVNGRINRVRVEGAADAGADIKARGWVLTSFTAVDARESVKRWNGGADVSIRSVNPRVVHLLNMGGGDWSIGYFQPESDDPTVPLVRFEFGKVPHTMTIGALDVTRLPIAQQALVAACKASSKASVLVSRDNVSKGSKLILPGGCEITP